MKGRLINRKQLVPVVTMLLLAASCSQKVDKGDDKLTQGRQQIEVKYKEFAQTVLFDNLETQYPLDPETPVIFMDDIVLGSGLVTSLDNIWLNFVGEDGFHPIGVCVGDAPAPGSAASKGYVERGTTRLIWEESLGFDKCMSVKDVVSIEIADSPDELPLCEDCHSEPSSPEDDAGVVEGEDPFKAVNVHYGGQEFQVDVQGLATSSIKDETVVLISTIIEAAGISVELNTVTIDLEANDGYPSDECEAVPFPGEWAEDKVGITVGSSTVMWCDSLTVDDCGHIRLMNDGHIFVELALDFTDMLN